MAGHRKVGDTTSKEEVARLARETMLNTFIGGRGSDAILAQEARGNREFLNSTQLPVDIGGADALKTLAKWGIKVSPGSDPIFQDAQLPPGWKRERGEDSRAGKIVDEDGRTRITTFYKAASYDRYARGNLCRRYSIDYDYSDDLTCKAVDGDTVLLTVNRAECPPDIPLTVTYGDPAYQREKTTNDWMKGQCKEYLDTNYPDWESVDAYWPEPGHARLDMIMDGE